MSESSGRNPNRLARETSPYLRQHAHNPVDWYPWGEEAFAKAWREEKPVFLSIGYSSCHWCHVMERESFENEEIARLLNESFVSIKVDREERPDVDDVYMTAVQLTTGSGGWPLSAFLLPDGRPFYAGTYFPPEDKFGRPGFRTVLKQLAEAWRTSRRDVVATAGDLAAEIASSQSLTGGRGRTPLSVETAGLLGSALAASFDRMRGGFGGAPKFPPHLALDWLLRRGGEGDAAARLVAVRTLEAMALGGIHDHLGGGFHRYATDARWFVPHFEKMLYDNAQLLGLYAKAFAATERELFRRTAAGIGEYLLREMRGPEGAFFAATDADSEGEEGKFFVWRADEIREVLGEADAGFFCGWYGVRKDGNYRDEASGSPGGANILSLPKEPPADVEARLLPMREKLLAARSRRVPPSLDDKRLSGWNALAVSGFAAAGKALGVPRFLEAARAAARFLLETARDGPGRLLRSWKDGGGKIPAFLEDEAYLANALLDLAEAEEGSASAAWLAEAEKAVASLRRRFRRVDGPGFALSGEGHEKLLTRSRDLFDKATPSASGWAARALARLARKSGDAALAREAAEAVAEVSWLMARAPHGTESWFLVLEELLAFDGEHPEAGIGALLAAGGAPEPREGESGDSLKVKDDEGVAEVRSREGALAVSFPTSLSAAPGAKLEIPLAFRVTDGWHLQGEDGIRVEPWGGSGFTFEEKTPQPNHTVRAEGTAIPAFSGSFEESLSLSVSEEAPAGPRPFMVLVTYRACGEGACRPEATLSFTVPFEILPAG